MKQECPFDDDLWLDFILGTISVAQFLLCPYIIVGEFSIKFNPKTIFLHEEYWKILGRNLSMRGYNRHIWLLEPHHEWLITISWLWWIDSHVDFFSAIPTTSVYWHCCNTDKDAETETNIGGFGYHYMCI